MGAKIDGTARVRQDGQIIVTMDLAVWDSVPCSASYGDNVGFCQIEPTENVNVKATLIMKSGETGFIGGLRRKNATTTVARLPIPYLQRLQCFSYTREIVLEEEYLVLVTPSAAR